MSVNICTELTNSYLDYAMSVIISRALPDIRDGCKPVQRRILYSMFINHCKPKDRLRKCVSTVGHVLSNFHPHGDQPVYQALVRLVQKFLMRYPLIEGQGNFGSLDGDSPASMRYTESRLNPISNLLLEEIKYKTVDMIPTYDNSTKEPAILPAQLPMLLLNGCSGIAVGMATNIPSHNIKDLINSYKAYVNNPDISDEELFSLLKGPDFATGGTIVNGHNLINIYKTGKGEIILQGNYTIVENNKNTHIILTSIPYKVNKITLIKEINKMLSDKEINGVNNIWDESNSTSIKIIIEISNQIDQEIFVNMLYKYTSFRIKFHCNFLAISNNKPQILNLRSIYKIFHEFREKCVRNNYINTLEEARNSQEQIFSNLVALDNIDEIVKIIKESDNRKSAHLALKSVSWSCPKLEEYVNEDFKRYIDINNYKLQDKQCDYILDLKFNNLNRAEYGKIAGFLMKCYRNIKHFSDILSDHKLLKESMLMGIDSIDLSKIFRVDRLTNIISCEKLDESGILVMAKDVTILLDENCFLKRLDPNNFKIQNRGGVGRLVAQNVVKDMIVTNTQDNLLVIMKTGSLYSIPVYKIPELLSNKSKGCHINSLINNGLDNKIITIFSANRSSYDYVVFVYDNGSVRKNKFDTLVKVRKNGKIISKSESLIINVLKVQAGDSIMLCTNFGYSILFNESEIPCHKNTWSKGVRGILLRPDDQVNCGSVVREQPLVLVGTELGMGKITNIAQYKTTHRGGKGILLCKLKEGDYIVNALICNKDEIININTKKGNLIKINVADIRSTGRVTRGVQVCKLKDDNRVVSYGISSMVSEIE